MDTEESFSLLFILTYDITVPDFLTFTSLIGILRDLKGKHKTQ